MYLKLYYVNMLNVNILPINRYSLKLRLFLWLFCYNERNIPILKRLRNYMLKVKVGNELLSAEPGQRLSEVLIKHGKKIEQPCGGRGTCGKCKVLLDGIEQRACQYVLQSDVAVELMEQGHIVSETGAQENGSMTERMSFVLDIGTTTLALALVSLDEQRIIKARTASNPQRVYGADIITRIDFCRRHGVEGLQKILLTELKQMLTCFQTDRLLDMYVAGNAAMLHIFYGVDPSPMGAAPYTPVFLDEQRKQAVEFGIEGVRDVISLPSVSAFVGADLVAGINYVGMPVAGTYDLLVDLGTNAEIILFSKDEILCTAASAGPCFEGANISCGMSATEGAITSFAIDESKKPVLCTIGGVAPKGTCGTGLVDVIAELVRTGIIDETGYMEEEAYLLADGVTLIQADVRQFQLAKSAVYSAIRALMHVADVSYDRIGKLYISGGFSAQMNVDNAIRVGLLPRELQGRIQPINNSSLLGTVKYACEGGALSDYVEKANYVDLAANSFFADMFIENMEF